MGLNFFTPINFHNQNRSFAQTVLEASDSYFYHGGEIAKVIPGCIKNNSLGVLISNGETPSLFSTALKIASYATIIIPLVMLILKVIMRNNHQFHLIDFEKELENGIEIDESQMARIQQLMPILLNAEDNKEIEWFSKGATLVFSLIDSPELVFKIANPNSNSLPIHTRFNNMVKATQVCINNQLSHLVVPHAKMLNIDNIDIIAEQRMDIERDDGLQEDRYRKVTDFETTARELVVFIAQTGFCDVEWRNIPILNSNENLFSENRVALIDLEHFGSPQVGIYGGYPNRRGLIRCLPNSGLMYQALQQAQELGINEDERTSQSLISERVAEVRLDNELESFFKNSTIVNLEALGLNLNETGEIHTKESGTVQVTLRQAAVDIINHINQVLEKNSKNKSTKEKHKVHLNTSHGLIMEYNFLGALKPGQYLISEEDKKDSWLFKIINALHKNNLIKLERIDNSGYLIYADTLLVEADAAVI